MKKALLSIILVVSTSLLAERLTTVDPDFIGTYDIVSLSPDRGKTWGNLEEGQYVPECIITKTQNISLAKDADGSAHTFTKILLTKVNGQKSIKLYFPSGAIDVLTMMGNDRYLCKTYYYEGCEWSTYLILQRRSE